MVNIGNDWDELLKDEWKKEYYVSLRKFLVTEYNTKKIYPPADCIFNALKYTAYKDVKVVIIGQDPYYNEGQAHGLCFSVQEGVEVPPSLKNIYKEIRDDLGIDNDDSYGCLTSWAKQGVLLLNTVLTVKDGHPTSHKEKGWEILTDRIINLLNERPQPIAFVFWGGQAKRKQSLITSPQHEKFLAVHPSPLSAYNGFFGCKHFSAINTFLKSNGMTPIDWKVYKV